MVVSTLAAIITDHYFKELARLLLLTVQEALNILLVIHIICMHTHTYTYKNWITIFAVLQYKLYICYC